MKQNSFQFPYSDFNVNLKSPRPKNELKEKYYLL